jgi:hypothetical protein
MVAYDQYYIIISGNEVLSKHTCMNMIDPSIHHVCTYIHMYFTVYCEHPRQILYVQYICVGHEIKTEKNANEITML